MGHQLTIYGNTIVLASMVLHEHKLDIGSMLHVSDLVEYSTAVCAVVSMKSKY